MVNHKAVVTTEHWQGRRPDNHVAETLGQQVIQSYRETYTRVYHMNCRSKHKHTNRIMESSKCEAT